MPLIMFTTILLFLPSLVFGDYDCICNYNVEKAVLPSPDADAAPIGYMYEFDCKPKATVQAPAGFQAVQFEKQLGYAVKDSQLQMQVCPGSPPTDDLVPTTTPAPIDLSTATTSTTQTTTTTTTTITTATPKPTTQSPPTSTSTTTPRTTTTTITSTTRTTTPTTTTTTSTTTPKPTTPSPTRSITTAQHWASPVNLTGTPYQYVGAGYNLLTENPDLGIHTTHQIFQLTGTRDSVHEATYENRTSCTPQKTTTLLHGSKAYQDELKTFVRPSSSHANSLQDAAFTINSQFTSMQQALDGSTYLYVDVVNTCISATVRYASEKASSGNFAVTQEFAHDVCALPTTMTESAVSQYMHFLDKWGTSIVTKVDLGSRSLQRYKTTPSEIFQNVQQTASNLFEFRGPVDGFSSSVGINTHDYGPSTASHTNIGFFISSFTSPSQHPVGVDLVPVVDALDRMYWNSILDRLVADGTCSDSMYVNDLDQYKTNFLTALNQFPRYKENATGHTHHQLLDRHFIYIPITWPAGTYGLMKARGGCPLDNVHWQEGWRKQDTEDHNAHNQFSANIATYMDGDFHSDDMTTHFCIKTSSYSGSPHQQAWPHGTYCILKKGDCPQGLHAGYIYWDDEDVIFGNNGNRVGGTLPDGTYNKDTTIYYCCRNDGSTHRAILLPRDRPFILIRYGSTCQQVHGMIAHDLFIRWDDENVSNHDSSGGMHPFDEGGNSDHRLHFCYYQADSAPQPVG